MTSLMRGQQSHATITKAVVILPCGVSGSLETQIDQVEFVDDTNRVAIADVIIEALGEQGALTAIFALNEALYQAIPALKSPATLHAATFMKAPRMTKAHASHRAQKLVELGWTVKHEFKADNETYEWYLEWEHVEEPPSLSSQDNGEKPSHEGS